MVQLHFTLLKNANLNAVFRYFCILRYLYNLLYSYILFFDLERNANFPVRVRLCVDL